MFVPDLEPCGSCSVALGPVPEKTPRDLLCVLVENVSGLEESGFELELIWEKQTAVVTFADPEGTRLRVRFGTEERTFGLIGFVYVM